MDASRAQSAHYNRLFAGINAFYWMGFASVWSYIAVILGSDGFSSTEIGVITSLATLLSIVVQPNLSSLADRSAKLGAREMACLLIAVILALTAALLLPGERKGVEAVLFTLFGLVNSCIPPFFNSMAMDLLRRGVSVNYGFGRGFGSLCYAVAAVGVGFFVERFTPSLTLVFFAAVTLSELVFVLLCKMPPVPACDVGSARGVTVGTVRLLRENPRLVLAMLGCVFSFASHTVFNTYLNAVVGRCGAAESTMGLVLGIAAAMELPAMSLFPRFRRRFSCETLLLISGAFFLIKTLLFLFSHTVGLLYLNAALQFFEHGIYVPATVYLVSELIDDANQVKGQGLIYAAGYGVGAAMGNLLGGWFLDRFAITGALCYGALSAAVGLVFFAILRACARPRGGKKQEATSC